MRRYRITYRPRAEADLFGLYHHIAEEAGHEAAGAYVDRIEATCMALQFFPNEVQNATTFARVFALWDSNVGRRLSSK